MNKKNRNLLISLLSLSAIGVLMIFILNIINKKDTSQPLSVEDKESLSNTPDSNTSLSKETIDDNNMTENKTLSVDPNKCRGCGRCAFIDSEHFEMVGGVSSVISQKNLDSSNLQDAINSCPVSIINLS